MPIFDFKCSNGHVHERMVSSDVEHVNCTQCAAMAIKQLNGCSFKCTGAGTFNGKMQVNGHVMGAGICKTDRER